MVAKYTDWGNADAGRIQTKECSNEELGIVEDEGDESMSNWEKSQFSVNNPDRSNAMFYPVHKTSIALTSYYRKQLHCFDFEAIALQDVAPKRIEIQGDFNSNVGRVVKLKFEKCDPAVRDTCKSEEELTEWMSRKYFIVLENRIRF